MARKPAKRGKSMAAWAAPIGVMLLALAAGKAIAAERTVTGRVFLKGGSMAEFKLDQCAGSLKNPQGTPIVGDFRLAPDGRFQIPNVAPGKYLMVVYGFARPERPTGPLEAAGKTAIASLQRAIEVPPDGAADQPLDLGRLELWVTPALTPGKKAPNFEAITPDGEEVTLKDVRGKFVLVTFWATWCGYCVAEVPGLKTIQQEFGQDPRFAMINLSLDKNMDVLEAYAKKNQLNWPQGFLGDWAQDKVSLAYDVKDIPALILIGPDGQVIDKGSFAKPIRESVAQALKAAPKEKP